MKNWKKGCAGILAAALTVSAVLPGTGVAVKAEGEAEAAASALLPKYEMKFDGSLEVSGTADTMPQISLVTSGESLPAYAGEAVYTEDAVDGQAINLSNGYGVLMDQVVMDETYTVSFSAKLVGDLGWAWPICSVSENNIADDWYTLAGGNSTQYQFWTNIRNNHSMGDYFNVPDGWAQYTMVQDGESVKLYENGQLIRSEEDVKIDVSNSFRVIFGANYWDATPDCYIDDVKLYDEAFSDAQAMALYTNDIVPVIEGSESKSVGLERAITLQAKVLNGDAASVSWESLNPEVASVDSLGIVTGNSEGSATIRANIQVGEETKTDTVTINVGKPIADFSFDDMETGFSGAGAVANQNGAVAIVDRENQAGKALDLNGTDAWLDVKKQDGGSLLTGLEELTVSFDSYSRKNEKSWSFFAAPNADAQGYNSENYAAAFDNATGLAFEYYKGGRGARGSASASCSYNEGWKHVDLVVNRASVSVFINKEKVSEKGIMSSLTQLLGENSILQIGKGNWDSGEYFQGQIDNYKIYNYAMTEEEITNIPVSEVTINGGTEVTVGDTMQLEAVVTPENATIKGVEWSSDNTGIAEVDQNGLVRGVSVGEATITAKAKDGGVIATQDIAVNPILVSSIEINGGSEVQIGGNLQLLATVSPANAANQSIEWSSEDSEIATVDENTGLVTGVSEGSVQIIAKALDGSDVSSSVTITVSKVPVTEVSIEGESERTMEIGDRITLAANVAPENATYKGIEWSSNNASVATVDQSGNVIAMASGEAVITAKSSDNPEITAQITVTVQEKKYTVMVTNGTIKDGKTEYAYKEQATVTAEQETAEGTFTHWEDEKGNILSHASTYTFFVTRDITLTACYSQEEAEEKATISCSASYDYAKGKFVFIAERSIPASLCADSTVVEHGIIVTTNEAIANDSDFQIGKSGVSKATAKTANGLLGTYILNVSSKSSNICYGRGYVTYRSAETNENVTLYSDIVLCQK